MRIQLRASRLALTKALRAQAELRLGLALGRFGERVGRVVGRLSQEGDQDGQALTRVRIDIDLHPRTLTVEETDRDLLVALNRAADRASRKVARALERERLLAEGDSPKAFRPFEPPAVLKRGPRRLRPVP